MNQHAQELNRVVAWLAFGDEVDMDGILINASKDFGYGAARHVPSYASDEEAVRSLIDHYTKGGAEISFPPDKTGCCCKFVPSVDDPDWHTAVQVAENRPMASCLALVTAASDVLRFHNRIGDELSAFLSGFDVAHQSSE